MSRPTSTHDLSQSERSFATFLHHLGHGRFESLRIERGELVLQPWPTTVRDVKFGAADAAGLKEPPAEFELKKQLAEFFAYVRSVDAGEIRTLEVKNGLPFSMEIEHRPEHTGGRQHA